MNTRLQVEHPVTEAVTGVDIVREQIRIAAGGRLRSNRRTCGGKGAAIECRVYAEDPEQNFLPSPGRITRLRDPAGPGVRDDSGVYEGWEVPIYYDPLISKLVAWGATREEAIARMRRALGEYHVGGIRTTIPFFPPFSTTRSSRRGEIDTGYIARFHARDGSGRGRGQNGPGAGDEQHRRRNRRRDRLPGSGAGEAITARAPSARPRASGMAAGESPHRRSGR